MTVVTTAPASRMSCCVSARIMVSDPMASWDSAQFINKQPEASVIKYLGKEFPSNLAWSVALCLGKGNVGSRQGATMG